MHPFCLVARPCRPSQLALDNGDCPFYPCYPIPFGQTSCVCPAVTAINVIVLARRYGEPTVKVACADGFAAGRAARKAGLGAH